MNISSLGGINVYSLTRDDMKNVYKGGSDFQQAMERKNGLTDEELEELKNKYNSNDSMSDKETADLMNDLANMGILSNNFARDISFGFVPMSMEDLHKTSLEACHGNYSALNVIGRVRGFDSMQATYEKVKAISPSDEYTKKYLADYETYMSILEKIKS